MQQDVQAIADTANSCLLAACFKEWNVICEAMGQGRQSIIVRKGGIHEGRTGFRFEHEVFYLFPTHFHAQAEMVRGFAVPPQNEWQEGDTVCLRYACKLIKVYTLSDWEHVKLLTPFHIYEEAVLQQRMAWQGRGMPSGRLQVALVRVYKLASALPISYEKGYGGCRSWLELPVHQPQCLTASPVLTDEQFVALEIELASLLEGASQ